MSWVESEFISTRSTGRGHGVTRVLSLDEIEDSAAEHVVHDGIHLVAEQELAPCAVALLVARVLPDLADNERLGIFLLGGSAQVLHKLIRQLVGDVQSPAGIAQPHIFADNAVLAVDVFIEGRRGLNDLRQRIEAPPALVVVRPFVELVPSEIRRILIAVSAALAISAGTVEIHTVRAGMGEYAVVDHMDTAFFRFGAEVFEILLGAEDRVDMGVIAGIVAVVGIRFKNRVEVDTAHAEPFQIVELFGDAL